MAQITNCLKLISRMPESDQDALVSRLDELQALGVPAQRAQVQAAIDLMARLEREANQQGIQRSAARDVTDTPEFKRWFGASKVVDADGRPMVVYHGTRSDLQEFDRRSIGSATDEGFLGDGFYFTDSPRAASAYAKGEGGNVVAAYVSIKNPYYAEGLLPDSMTAESLQASGFDGVIYQTDGSGDYSEFVAFRPEQIKSATGNSGTFDPNDANITRSATRTPAGVEIVEVEDGFDAMKDGKRIGRLRDNLPRGAAEQLDENASVDIVKVENEFKGHGVGSALYDAFNEKHGGRIAPSGKTSPEAWALWKRKFPQKVQEFVQAEAQRIRDGADPFMVMRNITDKDVARDVAIAAGDNVIRSVARNVAESAEFKRWFGDSKVVDADGKPLVVYHGSRYNADIKRFSAAKSEQSAAERGIYFTDSADHADQYASQWGDAGPEDGGSIYPVYLKIENPYVSNAWEWNMGTDITPAQARKQGHDGYVIQNHEGGTTYIAFRPEQIKSAIGNRGTFDPESPDITRSAARPEFFSQLQRSIEGVPDRLATMSAPQWKLWLDANAPKLGVKKDEIEWSTIKDYLTLRGKEKVTRDELVAYLGGSGVRVQEVVLGNQNDRQKLSNEYDRAVAASDAAGGAMNPTYIESLAPGDRKPEEQALLDAWNRVNENQYESWLPEDGNPKYGQYTIPGGENYREVLITLPSERDALVAKRKAIEERGALLQGNPNYAQDRKEYDALQAKIIATQDYKSSHWDQPNILAHLRVDDRVDADGARVLFIGELQSDWGQQAKKDGIRSSYKAEDVELLPADDPESVQPEFFWYFKVPGNVLQIPKSKYTTSAEARDYIVREKPVNPSGVPAAPFISDTKAWASLALKRAIMMAVEDGHDRVAFITGQQAADLYDLSKQIQSISFKPDGKGLGLLEAWDTNRKKVFEKIVEPREIEDHIGKEVAQRLLATDPVMGKHLLDGEQIKVGGEGMRAFYDQIIPQVARDVLKKLGCGQLTTINFAPEEADRQRRYDLIRERRDLGIEANGTPEWRRLTAEIDRLAALETGNAKTGSGEQLGFDITPAMREKVAAGVPLFSRRRGWDSFPDAIIATPPSAQSSDPSYAAAKGGDMKAALELVDRVMPDDIEQRVRATIGDAKPIVAAVHAEEAAGRNKIPLAAAFVLGERMGLQVDEKLVQASRAKRTGSDGMARLGVQPEFSGEVERGADYLLVDDTLAQGGTLAQLKTHIEDGGGRVVGVFALSGKQYSAKISLDNATLNDVRAKYGSIEGWWKGELGYGFEGLTQSEARYMLNSRLSPEALRDRVAAARQAAGAGDGEEVAGEVTRSTGRTFTGAAWDSPSASKFDDLVYKLQDKQVDTKRVVEAIKDASGSIADDLNVYLQEELYHGRAAKRTEDFVNMELNPLVEQLAKDSLKIEDLEEFLHARHAPEANKVIAARNPGEPGLQDGGSGMMTADALQYVATLPAALKSKLEAAAAKVDAIIGKTRELYVDYELESRDTVDGWGKVFRHYIPLQREDKNGSPGLGQGFSVKGRETKGRTGSTRKVVDILANIALQRERAVVRGEKNRVSQALVGLAAANPNPGFWEVDVVPTERVFNPETGLVEDRIDPLYKSRDNAVIAKISDANGVVREHAVLFNEDDDRALRMAGALKNLDAAQLEGMLGVSAKITRYFAAVNTQYNPVFGVVNLVRDVQGALLNLGSTQLADDKAKIAKYTASALRGIYGDARAARKGNSPTSQWARLWDEFQEVGGQTGYRELFRTSADRAEAIQKALNPDAWADSKLGKIFTANGALKVPMSEARKGAGWIFDWLSDYNLAMENGVRLAAYKAGIERGMSKEQAASAAKNLTVNFNRKGQVSQQAGAMYAFFNASIQGTARIAQTIFDMEPGKPKTIRLSYTGKKIVYGGIMLGSIQALALAAAGFSDEDPPEFARERSLIIPIGGKKYITIPMPLGFHVLPSIGRISTEFVLSGFKDPHKRALSLASLFADTFNPIGNAGLSMQTLAPTALDPLVALTENKDWTGKPIARESSNKAIPGHTLGRDTATSVAVLVSEAVNSLSGGNKYVAGVFSPTPDQIDYLIGQVTGGVGRELSKVEQTGLATIRGEALPTHKIPLVGRFVGDAKSQASEGSAFYANADRLNRLETEIKGLEKDGKAAEAAAMRRGSSEAYLITAANQAERQIQKLRAEKRELIKSGAPRERIVQIEEKITATMARLNSAAERLREKAEAN